MHQHGGHLHGLAAYPTAGQRVLVGRGVPGRSVCSPTTARRVIAVMRQAARRPRPGHASPAAPARPQARLGRDLGPAAQRWGPRPIDLDIVFYGGQTVTEGETLVVPHPRWQERDFVKAPLADLCAGRFSSGSGEDGGSDGGSSTGGGAIGGSAAGEAAAAGRGGGSSSAGSGSRAEHGGSWLQSQLRLAGSLWAAAGGERQLGTPDLECVLPMGRLGLWPWQRRSQVRRRGGHEARGSLSRWLLPSWYAVF